MSLVRNVSSHIADPYVPRIVYNLEHLKRLPGFSDFIFYWSLYINQVGMASCWWEAPLVTYQA